MNGASVSTRSLSSGITWIKKFVTKLTENINPKLYFQDKNMEDQNRSHGGEIITIDMIKIEDRGFDGESKMMIIMVQKD